MNNYINDEIHNKDTRSVFSYFYFRVSKVREHHTYNNMPTLHDYVVYTKDI